MHNFQADQALQHLTALGYKNGNTAHIRALPSGESKSFTLPDIPTSLFKAWENNSKGIYLIPNLGGHNDEKISQCVAIFYEHDDLGKEIQQDLWQHLGLPEPTIQIDTGGKSIHSYWTFEKPITPERWKPLQSDLLEYADADRKLKNPSRLMRLAGCVHQKTGKPAKIIGGCNQRYSYEQLRQIIPVANVQPSSGAKGITWSEFNQQWRFPISDTIPLESCLSRSNRELLASGQSDGSRNDSGFKLAADLVATTAFLTQEGQRFSGDPYSLFIEYCQKCPSGEGWNQREWDLIWKSAQQKSRNTSLSPEQIEGCVKGWAWNNCPDRIKADVSSIGKKIPVNRPVTLEDVPEDATDEEKLRLTIANYNRVLDGGNRFQQIPLRRAIAKEWGLTVSEIDELSRALQRGEAGDLSPLIDTMQSTQSEIEQRAQGMLDTGVRTGFYDLDAITQGFQRSDLVIVAARPSMGKTGWAINVARSVAGNGLPVAVFSLEMSRQQLAYRLLSMECSIESGMLRSGRLTAEQWQPMEQSIKTLSALPLYIDDTPAISVAEVRSKCRSLQSTVGQLGLILIDYLQLMDDGGFDRVQALDRITASLKALGRELNVPVIVLSQLSRAVEGRNEKRPMMSDIRESGGIEQNADLIAMLYRDEYYNPDTPNRGIAEVIITKHRNGPVGTIKLLFEPQYTRFRNLAEPASRNQATPQNVVHLPIAKPSNEAEYIDDDDDLEDISDQFI